MKSVPVRKIYEIINCHSPLVHPFGYVLANRFGDAGIVANFLVDFITIQNRRTHARPRI